MAQHAHKTYQMLTKSAIPSLFQKHGLSLNPQQYIAAAHVFPMRVNNHIVDDLVDWNNVPQDPIFQLSFPQPDMLSRGDMRRMLDAMDNNAPRPILQSYAESIRQTMNPHPANQKTANVPRSKGEAIPGMQHKYRETVLFFPSEGQYCHAFCTYCFRWAQFTAVGSPQTFKSNDGHRLRDYVARQPQVKDVLFTGGDPMVMSAETLSSYIDPLLEPSHYPHPQTIRIGSKSLAWWPYKYTTEPGAKAILHLFERVVRSGRQMTFQAHFSHPRELEHPVTQESIRLIRLTGAQIRGQAPLIRGVNDKAPVWQDMWNLQTRLGIVPYYMFVERDTGAARYFRVPLARAYEIFSEAYSNLAGTARTVRGPSMSASPGKVGVLGIEVINGQRVFVLKFWQARVPSWTHRVFFAKYDPEAAWLTDLEPAFGEKEFFFEKAHDEILASSGEGSSGQNAG